MRPGRAFVGYVASGSRIARTRRVFTATWPVRAIAFNRFSEASHEHFQHDPQQDLPVEPSGRAGCSGAGRGASGGCRARF
ncbi:hypothetical protein BZM27_54295, partial [Paraburkholderia steynii]